MTLSTLRSRLAAALLALCAAGLLLADDPPPIDKAVAKLIDQLGDDDPDTRDVARKQLFDRGEPVLDALKAAVKTHPDPDVRVRAIVLASDIRRGAFGQLRVFAGHKGDIRSLALSRDGKLLLSGARDGTARLWDVETGKELKQFEIKGGWGWQVAFARDEKSVLVAGGTSGTLLRFDVQSGKLLTTCAFPDKYWVYGAAFSGDGKSVFGGVANKETDFSIRRFDAATGKEEAKLLGHSGFVWRLTLSPDGKKLASIGCNDSSFRIWDADTGKELLAGKDAHEGWVVGSAFSPDGSTLLTSGRDSPVKLWDANTGRLVATFKGFNGDVESVAWSHDGRRILASDGKTIHVLERDTQKVIHRFDDHAEKVYSVAFLPDGRRAVSAGEDPVIRLWGVPK